ncbi:hypothetical protein [Haliscomenobacter sp.]
MTEYEKHKSDLAFEHDLINRRLTWLLTPLVQVSDLTTLFPRL